MSPKSFRFIDADQPLPFEEILAPLVDYSSGRLDAQSGTVSQHILNSALVSLERLLLEDLSQFSASALYAEFCAYRLEQQDDFDRLAGLAAQYRTP